MSEIKGTLLGIVLAMSAFAIVFGIISLAMKQTSNTISGRMNESAQAEPDVFGQVSTAYTIGY